jgi:hypothetical protein
MAAMGLFDAKDMMEDEKDAATCLEEAAEADKSFDAHVEAMLEANRGDGSRWYLDHMETFHENTTAHAGGCYYSFPLAYSAPLPSQHPLRVIAKIMDDAPRGSVVRVYAYMLTDFDAIDLLVKGPNGSRFTQMQIKGVLTESLSAFGSYNLTYPAKHASWEMITLKNTAATDIEFFENLWASCRPLQEANPSLLALAESPSRKERARTTKTG